MDSEHISIEMDTRICGHGIGYSLCPTCRPATNVENPFSGTNSETKSHDTAPRWQNIVESKLLDRHTGPTHASKPNMLETISGGLRQISNQYKQKVKDRQTAIQLALLPKSVKAVNKLKGFVLGCPGSKRTFVIPYHIMLSIVSFIGEVVECEVTGYSKTNNRSAKFEEQWRRVTGGDYNRGPREQIQAVLGKSYENGSYIHKYTYKMACFYFDDLLLSSNIYDSHDTIPEYILTRGRQSYKLIPHLQAQLKYFTSHYLRKVAQKRFRHAIRQFNTAITSREKEIARNVINLELNNCKLYDYPQAPSTFDAFVNGDPGLVGRKYPNEAFNKPVHCFVRDIQSLSSISCVNQQLHQFILNSPLWSRKQQLNMKIFREQQAIAIASLEPKIQKLLEKKVVIDVASEFSNQWTKNKKSEACMNFVPYCVMCLFCGLIWIPIAAYVEAQDRFVTTNTTKFTDVGISKYSDSYSFELLKAGFIVACVMISCLCLPIFLICRCVGLKTCSLHPIP